MRERAGAANPSFRDAMDELEGILERIEGEEIDIDRLAEELRRAAQLLDLCRGKIAGGGRGHPDRAELGRAGAPRRLTEG